MTRVILIAACLLLAAPALAANPYTSQGLRDVYYGEALYHAFQGDWFDSVARLDTELGQYRRLDEPRLDPLSYHLNQAVFGVGDFELGYRMHLRAGRAISAVIEGSFEEPVRNEAVYRLARLYFRKDQPEDALHTLERMRGKVPAAVRDDAELLRGEILLATGRYPEATGVFKELQGVKSQEGFASYNLGIALIKEGKEQQGRRYLERTGQLVSDSAASQAIRDKANLVLGYKLLEDKAGAKAGQVLDLVRLSGPFSNRALLGSGWSAASRGEYERALVPWSILAQREVTDAAVQEALLAVPYAYGKLNIYGKAALLYGKALDSFGREVDRLSASIKSVEEGKFLKALAREELKQDADWVVKLRKLPEAPETYYLLELMASHDFQESLRNYLDLDELQKKLAGWERDLESFEDMIRQRRAYYQPLLPETDRALKQLDSQMRLRLEQRERVRKRLDAMLAAPRPDYLATAEERIAMERIGRLERAVAAGGPAAAEARERLGRLRGVLLWNISTGYDQRLTDAYNDLRDLNEAVDRLKKRYDSFVRTRQSATLSYQGYEETIRRQRALIAAAQEKVTVLIPRQGKVLETMAVAELTRRRERLEQFKITARFAIADSYDRATRAQNEKSAAGGKSGGAKPQIEGAKKPLTGGATKGETGGASDSRAVGVTNPQTEGGTKAGTGDAAQAHGATARIENATNVQSEKGAGQ